MKAASATGMHGMTLRRPARSVAAYQGYLMLAGKFRIFADDNQKASAATMTQCHIDFFTPIW
jgi:hypothetical protein